MNDDRQSWTAYAEAHGLIAPSSASSSAPARSKYGAVATTVDGRRFDSSKEARVYQELKLRELAGAIAELRCQTAWPLHILELWRPGLLKVTTVGIYYSDFDFLDLETGEYKVVDVKSEPTRAKETYRLKKKLVEAIHGITIDDAD